MNNDKTQAKFTNWIDTLAYRTKLNYIRNEQKHTEIISIDEISDEGMGIAELQVPFEYTENNNIFVFASDWLEKAYTKLSERSREILRMFYVEGKNSQEIADFFGCTVRNINKEKTKALEFIRKQGENR